MQKSKHFKLNLISYIDARLRGVNPRKMIMAKSNNGNYFDRVTYLEDNELEKNKLVNQGNIYKNHYERGRNGPERGMYNKLFTENVRKGDSLLPGMSEFFRQLEGYGFPVKNDESRGKYIYLSEILKYINDKKLASKVIMVDNSCNTSGMKLIHSHNAVNGGRKMKKIRRTKKMKRTRRIKKTKRLLL